MAGEAKRGSRTLNDPNISPLHSAVQRYPTAAAAFDDNQPDGNPTATFVSFVHKCHLLGCKICILCAQTWTQYFRNLGQIGMSSLFTGNWDNILLHGPVFCTGYYTDRESLWYLLLW